MIEYKHIKSVILVIILYIQKRHLYDGKISIKEYSRAKKYYKKLTGADIIIAD